MKKFFIFCGVFWFVLILFDVACVTVLSDVEDETICESCHKVEEWRKVSIREASNFKEFLGDTIFEIKNSSDMEKYKFKL